LPLLALADLRAALERGRASSMLSTAVPVQVWAHRLAVALACLQALEQMHVHVHGLLAVRLRELIRLKIAAITTCSACQLARKTDTVTAADIACRSFAPGQQHTHFSEPEQAALRYAELFASDPMAIHDTVYDRLKRSFTVPEIVELNLFCALMLAQQAYEGTPMSQAPIFDIPLQRLNGAPITLAEHAGQVMLIVNVASKCGLTPQYVGLEQMHVANAERGLRVLGFPCNDFGGQEPGTPEEIESFCQANYGVSFPMYGKLTVNSAPRHALYEHLIAAQPTATPSGSAVLHDTLDKHGLLPKQASDVMWNFEKFLVGRDGQVLGRFAPDVAPNAPALVAAIDAALAR
jgi:glutathione peroxidase